MQAWYLFKEKYEYGFQSPRGLREHDEKKGGARIPTLFRVDLLLELHLDRYYLNFPANALNMQTTRHELHSVPSFCTTG